ncbi:MAG: hypothetical protein HGB12_07575 [Bacteroidetes bacterium]|nr:hypothetical protein [Bacteroidota bacterium]
MKKKLVLLSVGISVLTFLSLFLLGSCKKDKILSDTSAKLSFSKDTVFFDTVFTTVGSTTKQLKIFNTYNQRIKISSIRLADGANSNFTLNIDGIASNNVNDIEIEANDSIFIFVKVTVNPNNSNSPLVISDSLIFETNGNIQQIQLVAWGQDAYYHTPNHFAPNFPAYSIIECNAIWTNDKPHVIYGYAVVDSACTLTIKENARIYFHKNSVLWVYKEGTLKIEGTLDNPVTFQGDRLEQSYKDIPGQWGKIWLSAGSKNNEINHAIIKNGIIGIHVDTTATNPTQPTLKIENTIIENMSGAGILAQGSWVEAKNCVIANCGQYAVVFNIGGKYDFRHCTIGNYWSYSSRQTQSLVLNNYYEDVDHNIQIRNLENAYFGNCIIYGSIEEEIVLNKYPSAGVFNYKFENCLLKTKLNTGDASFFSNCIVNSDPAFTDISKNDYSLTSGSAAINKGNVSIGQGVPFDILNHNRTIDVAPDIGAYEKE